MRKKTERFHMLLTPEEVAALEQLAQKYGVSKANVIAGLIRRSAKRQKVWE